MVELERRQSAEEVLCHSHSPSFAEPSSGMTIRDVQKRQKPTSTPRSAEQVIKKCKTEKKPETSFTEKIDLKEIYSTLRKRASVIPFPQTLLLTEEEADGKCSVVDRKRVILKVLSLRFHLKVCQETLHLAIGLLDQCLDELLVDRQAIDDLAAVVVVIASKVEEIQCLSFSDVISCKLVQNESIPMIAKLERAVLQTLSFRITFPTPFTFATYLLAHLNASPSRISMTHYLLELSVVDVSHRRFPSDAVAHAATCLAAGLDRCGTLFGFSVDTKTSPLKALLDAERELSDFDGIDVAAARTREIMCSLVDSFIKAPREKHTVFCEYSSGRHFFVAVYEIDESLQRTLKLVR